MKKILFLTYFFPPDNASATQRIAKFAKHLPDFGYHPLIIKPNATQGLNQDQQSWEDIKSKVTVYPTFSLTSLFTKKHKAENNQKSQTTRLKQKNFLSNLFKPDPQIIWIPFVIIKAIKIIRKEKPTAIFASGYPFSLFIAGAIIKSLTNTPLVLSFHDPWTLNPHMPKWNTFLNRKLESWCIKKSNKCVFTSQSTQTLYEKKYPNQKSKFTTIYNGYDPADFQPITKSQLLSTNKTNLSYIGSLSGNRSPKAIIKTLHNLFQQHPKLKTQIHLNFFGPISPNISSAINSQISKLKLEESISLHGFVTHQEAINAMTSSDALVFITADTPGSEHIVAGKMFEYIAAKKPILAFAHPSGEATQILKKSGLEYIASQHNIQTATTTLYALYKDLQTPTINQKIDQKFIDTFSRKNLTAQLSKVFS